MSPSISFTFDHDASYEEVIDVINGHYQQDNPATGAPLPLGERNAAAVFTGQPTTVINTSASIVNTHDVNVQRDSDGFPYDERIHSSSRKITDKGVWARRKNISDQVWSNVRAELQQTGKTMPPAQVTAYVTPQGQVAHPLDTSMQAVATASAGTKEFLERKARLDWATEQTLIQLGTYPGTVENFEALKAGKMVTVSPIESAWFNRYTESVSALFAQSAPVSHEPVGQVMAQPQPYTHPATGNASPMALDPNTYAGFVVFALDAMKNGLLTLEQLNTTIMQAGVVDGTGQGNLKALGAHVDYIPAVLALLDAFHQVRP